MKKIGFLAALQTLIRIGIAPLSIFIIINNYDLVFQGFYYLFNSIVSSITLVEAGATYLIVRNLSSNNNQFDTEYIAAYRKYIQMASTILFVLIILFWIFFVSDYTHLLKIILLSFIVSFGLFIQRDLSIFEALDTLNYHRIKTYATILLSIALLVSLSLGLGLWAILISQLAFHTLLYFLKPKYLLEKKGDPIEVIKQDWKLNLTWVTGYFFWSFGIILYAKFLSIEDAGRFGLMHSIFYAIFMVSQSYIQGNRSHFVELAKESRLEFKYIIKINAGSVLLFILGFFALLLVVELNLFGIKTRLFETKVIVLYFAYFTIVLFLNNLASLARAFGGEPFFVLYMVLNLCLPVIIALGLSYIGIERTILSQIAFLSIITAFGLFKIQKVININKK